MNTTDTTNQTPEEIQTEAVEAVIRYAFLQGRKVKEQIP